MKIICVGRNYAAHAAELNNPVPKTPLLFMKPSTALLREGKPLYYPDFTQDLHYECELVVRIIKNGKSIAEKFAPNYYNQISLGIDFTARDIQRQCKEKGHPWEIAKSWDHSAAIGTFIPFEEAFDQKTGSILFGLQKNQQVVQQGDSKDMLTTINQLISYISGRFTLQKGDLIYTGTPAGVGAVQQGDHLEGFIGSQKLLDCKIK